MPFAYGREKSLPLVLERNALSTSKIREISVFVDESGSFESDEESSRFYIVCFLFHDQSNDIAPLVAHLETYLGSVGLGSRHCVHVGPLVRREGEYANMLRVTRQAVFRKMMAFVRKAEIMYKCFSIDKHFDKRDTAVHDRLLQDLIGFLIRQRDDFNSFDRLKIYYDNGQSQVKSLLLEAFAMFSSKTEFVPDVHPDSYRLFQAADLLCTVELAAAKAKDGELSVSERRFFGEKRIFMRNILKPLRRKALQ